MAWRDSLRPASWRGVAFSVEADEFKTGRRVQIHEYPLRDKPYAEDLGRAARAYAFTAFLIGDDYPERRDQLIEALERPGVGKLVHPFYGEVDVVSSGEVRVTHSKNEGGMCRIDLNFTEAGELAFPSRTTDTSDKVLASADAAQTASVNSFADSFTVDGLPDFVSSAALADLGTIGSELDAIAGETVSADLAGMDVAGLLDVETLGNSIWNSVASTVRDPLAAITENAFVGEVIGTLKQVASIALPVVSLVQTASRIQQAINSGAIVDLVTQAALTEMARAAAVNDWLVFDDAVEARDDISALFIDAAAGAATDTVFRNLENLRIETVQDITAKATGAPRVVQVERNLGPAVVAAYDLYEDANRAEEIVTRNKVVHPAWINPDEPVRVLTR